MPIYEYECQACGHCFEQWQKMSDKPVRVCPKCKSRKVEKLISQTSFQLKGGGWYKDLYASEKPAAASSAGAPSAPKTGAAASGESSDSKPAHGKGKKGASKVAA